MAGGKSSVPRSYGESSDDYPQDEAVLADDRSVIECADGIQWIIQKRVSGPRPWRPVYYCRTKAGLLLYARPITSELLALPDYFPDSTPKPERQEQRTGPALGMPAPAKTRQDQAEINGPLFVKVCEAMPGTTRLLKRRGRA
jgi:hypothetical protein